jgi:ABC-2 type transport system ATP-binding protein
LASGGATVLLTTQYLDEADELAARIAVIDHGRAVAEGTPTELKASVGAGTLRIRLIDPAQRAEAGRMLSGLLGVPLLPGPDPALLTTRVPAGSPGQSASDRVTTALAALAGAGIPVGEFALGQPSLDEVFLTLTGNGRVGGAASDDSASDDSAKEAAR